MILWELTWWEMVFFGIAFGVILYLILKAPDYPDSPNKYTSSKSTGNCSSNKFTLPDKPGK